MKDESRFACLYVHGSNRLGSALLLANHILFCWTNTHLSNALCVYFVCILYIYILNTTSNFYTKGTSQVRALVHSFCLCILHSVCHCTLCSLIPTYAIRWYYHFISTYTYSITILFVYSLQLKTTTKNERTNLFRCCMILCCWQLFDQRVPFLLFHFLSFTLAILFVFYMLSQVIKPLFVNVNNVFFLCIYYFIYVMLEPKPIVHIDIYKYIW